MAPKPPEAFGGLPEVPLALDPRPLHALFVEWPWLHPLTAILGFTRWTIDDVVSNPRAAWEVRCLWKLFKAAQHLAQEREQEHWLSEQRWLRRHGCPVPCPECGDVQECECLR